MVYNGIDVSKYQGEIDWVKVKNDGVNFAFIRIGWAGYKGEFNEGFDAFFNKNVVEAIAAGVNVGVYAYLYCKTPEAAEKYAQNVIDYIKAKNYKINMPIVCDFEDNTTYPASNKILNTNIALAFLKKIEENKFYSMFYTYKSFALNNVDMDKLKNYDFWLAHYITQTDYKGNYGIWQYTSSGKVNGINGNVDKNYSYKDYPVIIKNANLNINEKPIIKKYKYVYTSVVDAEQINNFDKYLNDNNINFNIIEIEG